MVVHWRLACCLLLAALIAYMPGLAWAKETPAPASPFSFSHTVAVPFGGELTRTVAARVSEAMARTGAMQRAARWLEAQQDVALGREAYEGSLPGILRDAQPLAWMLFTPLTTAQEQMGRAPDLGVRTTVTARQTVPLAGSVQDALQQPVTLQLHRMALDAEQSLLRRFVSVSAAMPDKTTMPDALNRHYEPQFRSIADALHALSLLRAMLHDSHNGQWNTPETTMAAAQNALELAPEEPLLWYVRGSAALQLQRTQEALDALTHAIERVPDFALALHERGTAYVRVHLTDLAIADYDAAITLQPRNADMYRSRGSAYLVREEFASMCRDFYTACTLGQCENYHWATSRGHCAPTSSSAQP